MSNYAYKKRRVKNVVLQHEGEELTFYVRSLTAAEFMELQAATVQDGDLSPEYAPRLLSLAICDEHGNPLYASEEGVVEIGQWDMAIVLPLVEVAAAHCGLATPKKV